MRHSSPAKAKAYHQKKKNEDKFYVRRNNLRVRFGITLEEYQSMFDDQQGLCAICHKSENRYHNGAVKLLCIDHNHVTGKIRKLLCANCNTAIGLLDDNAAIVREAADYLKNFEE